MIFDKTVRSGLMLVALASGCGDDDGLTDASRDTGSMLDAAMADSPLSDALQEAIRAACTKLNECDSARYPIDACTTKFERDFRSAYAADPDCDEAYAAFLGCAFDPACSVIADGAMYGTYVEEGCRDEEDAVAMSCTVI